MVIFECRKCRGNDKFHPGHTVFEMPRAEVKISGRKGLHASKVTRNVGVINLEAKDLQGTSEVISVSASKLIYPVQCSVLNILKLLYSRFPLVLDFPSSTLLKEYLRNTSICPKSKALKWDKHIQKHFRF